LAKLLQIFEVLERYRNTAKHDVKMGLIRLVVVGIGSNALSAKGETWRVKQKCNFRSAGGNAFNKSASAGPNDAESLKLSSIDSIRFPGNDKPFGAQKLSTPRYSGSPAIHKE
jgi:hypothetical protein